MEKPFWDIKIDLTRISLCLYEVEEFTKFVDLESTVVYSMFLPECRLVPICTRARNTGSSFDPVWEYDICVMPWFAQLAKKFSYWRKMLEANLLHEKSHIMHDDFSQYKGKNKKASIEAHRRWVPVISEARADRYVCKCGRGEDLLRWLRWNYWSWPFMKSDLGARIELVKRYLKKHNV